MGYRSDVKIVVALPSKRAREEVMALYAMHPLVQKHDLAGLWQTHDMGDAGAYLLIYEDECTKWYSDFEDVQAMEYMHTLLEERANADDSFRYARRFVRVGEEIDDIEREGEWSDDSERVGENLHDLLHELLDVRVEINLDICR